MGSLGHTVSLWASPVKTRLPVQDVSSCRFSPWGRKIPWRGARQPTPVFLPGESLGQRSLVGYRLWGHKDSDTAEAPGHANVESVFGF